MENGFRVLIAACDTFRAGAVEQLRTHAARLNSLHPVKVKGGQPSALLYEKGYGKDAAGIAMQAISAGMNLLYKFVETLAGLQLKCSFETPQNPDYPSSFPDIVPFS